jgi:hypothetical protein
VLQGRHIFLFLFNAEKTEEFKKTTKIKIEREMMQERLDELEKLRGDYEEKLSIVREEVRTEIKSKESPW